MNMISINNLPSPYRTFFRYLKTFLRYVCKLLATIAILMLIIILAPLNMSLKMFSYVTPQAQTLLQILYDHTDLLTRNNGYNTILSGNVHVLIKQKVPLTQIKWSYTGTLKKPLQWNLSSIDMKNPLFVSFNFGQSSDKNLRIPQLSFTAGELSLPLIRIKDLIPLSKTFNFAGNVSLKWNDQILNLQKEPNYLQAVISCNPLSFDRLEQKKLGFYQILMTWEQNMNQQTVFTAQLTTPNPENSDYVIDGTWNLQRIQSQNQTSGNLNVYFPAEDSDFMMNQVLPLLPQKNQIQLDLEQRHLSILL
jgi:hypothetical protein